MYTTDIFLNCPVPSAYDLVVVWDYQKLCQAT